MAAPAPGRPTAEPIKPPAAAPPRAPIPAPFSRVVNDPPAQPATNIDPAKKSTEALPTGFVFVFIVVFSFFLPRNLYRSSLVPCSSYSSFPLSHWPFACRDFAWICSSLESHPGVAGVRPREPSLVRDLPTIGHLSWRILCCSYESLLDRLYLSLYRPAQHWPMSASS